MGTVADYIAFHRGKAIADQWKVRTGAVFLAVLVAIAGTWFTVDLFCGRISMMRFEVAMVAILVMSILWIVVFARTWRKSKVVLTTMREELTPDQTHSPTDRSP